MSERRDSSLYIWWHSCLQWRWLFKFPGRVGGAVLRPRLELRPRRTLHKPFGCFGNGCTDSELIREISLEGLPGYPHCTRWGRSPVSWPRCPVLLGGPRLYALLRSCPAYESTTKPVQLNFATSPRDSSRVSGRLACSFGGGGESEDGPSLGGGKRGEAPVRRVSARRPDPGGCSRHDGCFSRANMHARGGKPGDPSLRAQHARDAILRRERARTVDDRAPVRALTQGLSRGRHAPWPLGERGADLLWCEGGVGSPPLATGKTLG